MQEEINSLRSQLAAATGGQPSDLKAKMIKHATLMTTPLTLSQKIGGKNSDVAAIGKTDDNRMVPKTHSTLKPSPKVREHTTDQLGRDGDEYVPRDFDDAGERKVDALGQLKGGREYKIRTFTLPGRGGGDKIFMLATECARTLQYRDSYLLFNKNQSLFKIIASVAEKQDLIGKDILPYSYRSRQIAIVTARSMFRQFGSRVVKDGRRVRDDYWEAKAIEQGFTRQILLVRSTLAKLAPESKLPNKRRCMCASSQQTVTLYTLMALAWGL